MYLLSFRDQIPTNVRKCTQGRAVVQTSGMSEESLRNKVVQTNEFKRQFGAGNAEIQCSERGTLTGPLIDNCRCQNCVTNDVELWAIKPAANG